jgi:TRAP-type C4-dicarboxylate transport system permease small subunit
MLAALERTALSGTRALSVLGLLALLLLATITLADGLMRWLANQPIEGVRDVGALALAVAISCCLPVGLMERSNITIRFIGSIVGRRTGQAFDVFAALAVALVLVVMAYQFFLHASKLARANETTWVLKLPTAPFWYGVDAILWCAVAVQAIVIAQEIGRLLGRSVPAPDDAAR